jgi:hypothetical protein
MKKKVICLAIILISFLLIMTSCSNDSTEPNDSTVPEIQLTYPTNDLVLPQAEEILITAEATDNEAVKKVIFYIGEQQYEDTSSPYSYSWNTIGLSGTVNLYVKAIDTSDNETYSDTISVMIESNAQISFIANEQSIQVTNSWDIKLVDISGDGNLDAYFGSKTWINNGNGNFSETDLSFGSGIFASFGDLNGDGFVDVVCQDSIYLNDGENHYEFKIKLSSDIVMHSSVLGDVDNDGDIDIISCSTTSDRILLNDGKANFTNSGKSLGGWGQASYTFGDINSDGFTDIYVAIPHTPPPNMQHTANKIWFGSERNNFTLMSHDITNAVSRNAILCDFDNDGNLDLFLASNSDTGNMIFFNDGNGNFKDSGQMLGNNSNNAKTADLDVDGDSDLFICYGEVPMGNGAPNKIWINDGKGHFTDSDLSLGNSNSAAVELGDIDKDGKIDAIVVNVKLDAENSYASVPCPVEIWLNKTSEKN